MFDAHAVLVRPRGPWRVKFSFAIFLILLISAPSRAEPSSFREQVNAGLASHRIYRNYAGAFVMRFPNYDLRISGPSRRGLFRGLSAGGQRQVLGNAGRQGPIVFRNDDGMVWDGANLFIHPAYPYRMLTEFRFDLNMIGQPLGTKWPFDLSDQISAGPQREVMQFARPVGFRPMTMESPSIIPAPNADGTLKFLLPTQDAAFEKGVNLPLERVAGATIRRPRLAPNINYANSSVVIRERIPPAPQVRHPSPHVTVPTRPVSTIRVQQWAPRAVKHPVHDALGTFSHIPPVHR